ncbi:hypothetical protein SAMN06298216_2382 [Spirosomataceae bacterium TFI 002]|nr:hypothetical protein SAMN06298216_2382 [Spirosomataceae bacterium TFI 002]
MRLLLILLLTSVFGNKVLAQNTNYLQSYFPNIHDAEMNLIEDNYYQALVSYAKAFDQTSDGHLKDYFNAAVCATYLGDATTAYKYLEKTAEKGLSLDFVKSEVAFQAIQKDPEWRDFELVFLSKRRGAEQQINKDLKNVLDILVSRGNWFRERNAETFADTIAMIDADNALILDSLMNEFGFPGENEIGIGEGGYPIIQYPFYEIIKLQVPSVQVVNFSNKIISGMKNGRITPHIASSLLRVVNDSDDYFSRFIYMIKMDETLSSKPVEKVNQWVHAELTDEDERRFNELRLNFGLETLEDYQRKILFSLQDHRFLLPYKTFANIWYARDAEIAAQYLENTVIAK